MADISQLLFQREHFPIVISEVTGKGGKFWDFGRIEIPPYHPAMLADGIDFKSVPSFLDEAVEATIKDLEEIGQKRKDIQALLKSVVKNPETGKIAYQPAVKTDNLGIEIDSVPVIGHFYVGRSSINPYGYNGDQGISINPSIAAPSFKVPARIKFIPELMSEYGMKDEGIFLKSRRIACPNGWYRHNLEDVNAIFYKNIVITLDNAVVRRKYEAK